MSLQTYITEIEGIPPYNFIIPPPKNNLSEYMLLLKDANARIISGITNVT